LTRPVSAIYDSPGNQRGPIMPKHRWGRIRKRTMPKKGTVYAVVGTWKGREYYFSRYQSEIGPRTCASRDEAKDLQLAISLDMARGIFNPLRYKQNSDLHLGPYASEWLLHREQHKTEGTLKGDRAAVRHILAHPIAQILLEDLIYRNIEHWVDDLSTTLNIKTVKNYHATLAMILRDAHRNGYIQQMPYLVQFTGSRAIPHREKIWINQADQAAILAAIPAEHRPIFRFLFAIGVRPSEARALQISDPHPERGYLTIRYTLANVKGQGEQLKPVKQKRERKLPWYDGLTEIIDSLPRTPRQFVFLNPTTGRPYTKNINRIYNPACIQVKGYLVPLNNAGRHSWANQLLAAGVPMADVSQGLGHSGEAITKQSYGEETLRLPSLAQVVNLARASR